MILYQNFSLINLKINSFKSILKQKQSLKFCFYTTQKQENQYVLRTKDDPKDLFCWNRTEVPIFKGDDICNSPHYDNSAFIAASSTLVGNVEIFQHSSVWYGCVLRAENSLIRIAAHSNIQDNTIITESSSRLGPDHDGSVIIGSYVTIGHACLLRACTIHDNVLIGMKSIIDEEATIESNSIVAAGSVVTKNTVIPSGELWAGNPARFLRKLTDHEIHNIRSLAERYSQYMIEHKELLDIPIGTQWREAEKLGFGDIIGYKKIDF